MTMRRSRKREQPATAKPIDENAIGGSAYRPPTDEELAAQREQWERERQENNRRARFDALTSVDIADSNSYRSLKRLVDEIARESFGEMSDDTDSGRKAFRERVSAAMGPIVEKAILGVLGLKENWGKIEVSDGSPLNHALKERAAEHAKEIVDNHLAESGWPAPKDLAKIVKEHSDHLFSFALRNRVQSMMEKRIKELPDDVFLPMIDEVLFTRYPILKRLEAMQRLTGKTVVGGDDEDET